MANTDAPRGFEPFGKVLRVGAYLANTSTDIGAGDAVEMHADGYVIALTTDAGGAMVVGVALEPVDASASSSQQTVLVADHPDQRFIVQCDTGTDVAVTDKGSTADIEDTTLDTTFMQSRQELDSSDLGTDASSCLKLIDLVDSPNNAWGAHVDVIVVFDRHAYKTAGGT